MSYNMVSTANALQTSADVDNLTYIPFRTRYATEKRKKWADEASIKFPYKIPVIIE